jgi:formylglycine-generating enzyme required for sulfatase activity
MIRNSNGMTFVRIPKGTFMMGAPLGEQFRSDEEYQHEVTRSRDFHLGVCGVTQDQ